MTHVSPKAARAILAMAVLAGGGRMIIGADVAKPGADETRCSCGGLVRWHARERRGYCTTCGRIFREAEPEGET